jgi:anti-sigma-K factor RskA
MTEQTHDDVKGIIGAYVLGAVPAEEIPSIRAHILSCVECKAHADELSRAVESLSLSVEPVAPPPDFTQNVLERAARESSEPQRATVIRRRWRPLEVLAYAAVVVFAAVMGAIALDARQDAAVNRRVAVALLEAAEGIELQGQAGVAAKVVTRETGAVFVATGLEDPPDDRIYQLWFMRDGVPVSSRTFDVSEGVAVVRAPDLRQAFDGAAVTVEPSGGSQEPTTKPVIQSS